MADARSLGLCESFGSAHDDVAAVAPITQAARLAEAAARTALYTPLAATAIQNLHRYRRGTVDARGRRTECRKCRDAKKA